MIWLWSKGDSWRVCVGDRELTLAAVLAGDTLALQRDGLTVRFTVAVEGGLDLRRAVFSLAVERGWVLLEMAQSTPSLEAVFLRLTTHDVSVEAPAEPVAEAGEEVANA